MAAALEHPHVIPIHEAGEVDGTVFLAMRYVAGSDLKAVLLQDGRLSPQRALVLISQVGSALDAAHASGLVHRDVKPGNLLVASGMGDVDHAYLCDFGLAKQTRVTGQRLRGDEHGRDARVHGAGADPGEAIDGRVDVYALGCVLISYSPARRPTRAPTPPSCGHTLSKRHHGRRRGAGSFRRRSTG